MRTWLPAVVLSLFATMPSVAADGPVDLELSFAPNTFRVNVIVQNNGPSNATDVRLCTADADSPAPLCRDPFELAAGASRSFGTDMPRAVLSAKVTQHETDTNPENSRATWLAANAVLAGFDLFTAPGTPRAGETGTLFLVPYFPIDVELVSTDRNVLTLAPHTYIPPGVNFGTVQFRALRAGTATIIASSSAAKGAEITVHVVGRNDLRRLPPVLEFTPELTQWTFGSTYSLPLNVLGMTADGVKPSGSVTFYDGGTTLGSASISAEPATIQISLRPGAHTLAAIYGGDGLFLPSVTSNHTVQVKRATPVIHATADGSSVLITVEGVAGTPPTGIIGADEDGRIARNVSGPLVVLDDTSSIATASGFSTTATTVTITYFGDANYAPTVASAMIARPKRRAAGH
jgi:hypothetical protein